MKFTSDGPPVLPLWINGHPYLTVGDSFFAVCTPQTGQLLRRVPLCSGAEVDVAVNAARLALEVWAALPLSARRQQLLELAEALEGYTDHFAQLLAEESGRDAAESVAEVELALTALRSGTLSGNGGRVLAVLTDASRPLVALTEIIAPALLAGATIVCKPSPQVSGAAFALCELSGRVGWPAGVLNLVHGDNAVVEALSVHPEVAEIAYRGEAALGEQLRAIVAAAGKPFVAGAEQ